MTGHPPRCVIMLVVVAVVLVAVAAVLVVPRYRQAVQYREKEAALQQRIVSIDLEIAAVEALAHELEQLRLKIAEELKFIPESADVADLMRRLSVQVDGAAVHDQTFTAGSPTDAVHPPDDIATQALPVTIEMQATFDSVFAVMHAAESMRRLVRLTGVRLNCTRDKGTAEEPLITASITLEAIYDPKADARGQKPEVTARKQTSAH